MSCSNGNLDSVKQHAPAVLASLKSNGISDNILGAMICIACANRYNDLLDYCFSLSDNPVGLMEKMENAIWITTKRTLDPGVWAKLLDYGWLSRPPKNSFRCFSKLADLALQPTHLAPQSALPIPRIELMEVLFSHGYVLSNSALHDAIQIDFDTIRYLLSKMDADKIKNSSSLLMSAAEQHDPQVVELLLDSGVDINWMSSEDKNWNERERQLFSLTALHCAAENGSIEVVELLLQRGARRDIKDSWGRTPAMVALRNNRPDVAQLIQNFIP
ncbi:ankyrin repeat-containing domain protein [Xylogone sp. PMI_703]|nr:ankyrin repeat-containing domain protein [Xylogone sp. PMI_703]